MENKTKIPLTDIKKKLNTKKSIIDFFREQGILKLIILYIGLFYPNFSSFNYAFCLQVLRGDKKVII